MATASKREVGFVVGIETTGSADIQRLAAEVRKLGAEGDPAAAEFRTLADQLDRLGQQADAVTAIRSLNTEVDRLAASQVEAAAATVASKDALAAQTATVARLKAESAEAVAAVNRQVAATRAVGDSIKALNREYTGAARETQKYKDEVKALQTAQTESRNKTDELRTARSRASAELTRAIADEGKLATAYLRTREAAGQADAAVRDRATALRGAQTAAAALGATTTDLAQADAQLLDSQGRLIAQLNTLKAEQAERLALDQQNAAALERTTQTVRALSTAYEAEQAALAESAAAAAKAAAEKLKLAEAAEKAAASARDEVAAATALSAKRNEQAESDLLAARAAAGLAEARARATLAAQSELAAIKDSEEFTRRYAAAQREAAAAVEAEGVEAMRKLEAASRAADKAQEQLVASLRETEAAAEKYAAAIGEAAAAGEQDVAASQKRRAAAEALIASERALTAEQREAAQVRDRTRVALVAEAQALLASARAADESRAATARLVQQAISLGTAVDGTSKSIRQMGTVSEQAFGTVGIRGLQSIETEIRRVDLAMIQLSRDLTAGRISADDFARATGAATLKLRQLNAEARQIQTLPGQFERISASIQGVIARFGALGAAVATVGVAVRPVIEATIALEQMRRALTTVTGSAEEAERQIDFVRATSVRAGQAFTEVGQSYSKFAASALQSGLSLKQVQGVFESVSLAAGNLGLSSDQSKRALEALSQIASKGVVSMEELRQQLGDALPGVLPLLAKELGITQQELNKVVEAGNLLAVEAIPAIGRALKSLGPQDGVVNGMVATWNRFTSVVKQAGTTLVEGPLGGAAGILLTALAGVIRDVGTVAVGASEAFKLFGLSTLAVFDALTPGGAKLKDLGKTLDDFAQQAATNIQKYKDTAYAGAEGTKALADEAVKLGGSLAQVAIASQKSIDLAVLQAQGSEKNTAAKKIEGEALATMAGLLGDETASREANLAAARANLEAANQQVAADERVVTSLTAAKDALLAQAKAQGLLSDTVKTAIEAYDKKIIKATADLEKTEAQATAARAHAVALGLSSAAARNNADRIDELRKAHEDAIVALELSRIAIVNGAGSEQDAVEAAEALAVAKGLLRDAIDDVSEALDRQLKALQADQKLAEAGLKLEIERQKNAVIAAQIAGNEYKVKQALLAIKEAELRLGVLSVEGKRAEAEATLRAIDVQEQELRSLGQLTPEKAVEFETRRKVQLAAVLEAQATNESAESKRKELEALRVGGPVREQYTKAVDTSTTATKENSTATGVNTGEVDRNSASHRKGAADIDTRTTALQKYVNLLIASRGLDGGAGGSGLGAIKDPGLTDLRQAGGAGNRLAANGGDNLSTLGTASSVLADNSYLFQVLDRIDNGGKFGADDLTALKSLRETTRTNAYYTSNSSIGSLRSGEFDAQAAKVQAAYEQAYQASQSARYGFDSAFGGYKGSTISKTVNVNLKVSGKTVPMQTSETYANQLLKALEDAQRASGAGP